MREIRFTAGETISLIPCQNGWLVYEDSWAKYELPVREVFVFNHAADAGKFLIDEMVKYEDKRSTEK